MSVIGTGIAAGVANTANQARKSAQQRGGEDAQRAAAAKQTDKLTVSQLHDAGATRDADQEMPDQQAPGYEDLYDQNEGDGEPPGEEAAVDSLDLIHQFDAPAYSPTGLPLGPTYGPDLERAPLFHQLDVTG